MEERERVPGGSERDTERTCHHTYEKLLPGLRDLDALLNGAGVSSVEELFADIPPELRIQGLALPDGMAECELVEHMRRLLCSNKTSRDILSFLGAGYYRTYIPAAVKAVTSRSELYTAYTPYQAEASQGMLQALFEFQSMICELTGMEVTNTSMYDGPTALGEAALMAARITKKKEIIIPRSLHWEKAEVLRTYARGPGLRVRELPFDLRTGKTDWSYLKGMLGADTAAVVVSNPNVFGVWEEEAPELRGIIGDALLIADVNPLSLGVARAPGDYGADIVVGEGQPLGTPLSFGGPSFGILATRKRFVRDMPGRLIGMTRDAEGRRAFCMTLQTREQHIRRAKATSNICSNEALCAIAAAAYLSVLGRRGLRQLGISLAMKARELARALGRNEGIESPLFEGSHFNEFVIRSSVSMKSVCAHAARHGILAGVRLRPRYPELGFSLLVTVSEAHTREDFERLASVLGGVRE
ncbi:MAG: aminomethyl-transferring glycine dehydrogenase subunit GcvPA [Thermoplasmata archaeon]